MSIRQERMAEERVERLKHKLWVAQRNLDELKKDNPNVEKSVLDEAEKKIKAIDYELDIAMNSNSY